MKAKNDIVAQNYRHAYAELVSRSFVTEGTLIAFGLCFPGATTWIPADESRITALDMSADHLVYGGTSGRLSHLFVGMFHGLTGVALDLGTVEGMDCCVAVCCGQEQLVACLNGPAGSRIVAQKLQAIPFDCIQEWFISRDPIEDWADPLPPGPLLHAVIDASKQTVVGITPNHLFCVDVATGTVEVVGAVQGTGRLALGPDDHIWGIESAGSVFCFQPDTRKLTAGALPLPKGLWDAGDRCWGKDASDGKLYLADDEGTLYAFKGQAGFSDALGKTPVETVGAMAATYDGRLYGNCGEGIGRMFCYNPETRAINDLGVAASVLHRRRYGYVFSDAAVGRDGQIYFAENDNLGHLWIYFPSIPNR